MLLCIDIGNTNIVFGVADKNTILYHWRIRTQKTVTSDEIGITVSNFFESVGLKSADISNIIVTSVVPALLNTVEQLSNRYFRIKPMIVDHGTNTGMPIRYDNPRQVGSDRIVNAVGAYEKYRRGLIVVDLGTATTFDYISKDGHFMGGPIAPGMLISCEALFQKASKLPRIEIFSRPDNIITRDTVSSMNAGIIYGYAGLIDGIVNKIKKESGEDLTVLATGGLAPLICDVSETIDHVEEFLTLQGLIAIFKKNR